MRAILTIAEREIRSYFMSPIGFVVLAAFLVSTGYFFDATLSSNQGSLRPMILNTVVLLVFLLPALTMRLLAEEKKTGSIEILMTSPVTDLQVTLGKFLGVTVFYVVLLGATLHYPFTLNVAYTTGGSPFFPGYAGILVLVATLVSAVLTAATPNQRVLPWITAALTLLLVILAAIGIGKLPEPGPVLTGYLGLLLLGMCFLSVGMVASALTRNQIVAYVVSMVVLLAMLIINWLADSFRTNAQWFAEFLDYLSVSQHLDNFSKGVIDVRDIFLYLSITVVGLILTVRALATGRWK